MGCLFPQLFAAGGDRVGSRFLGRNQRPAVSGVQDPHNMEASYT
jgi:hypothetical protein